MTIAHFIMQGKGGVGKSLVSSILIQYLLKRGLTVSGCDTDPVNSSLARHQSLDVKVIDIMDNDDIDPGRFDELIRHIDGGSDEAHMVIDIGASCFVSLCAYLKKYDALW
jgi:cellulose biosynthesis protein BcsQ